MISPCVALRTNERAAVLTLLFSIPPQHNGLVSILQQLLPRFDRSAEEDHHVSAVPRPHHRVTQSKTLLEEDPAQTRASRNTQSPELRFRALLGREPKVEEALV
jgi:hypothetical protein